jgi:Protein of unknown function (DUF2946)
MDDAVLRSMAKWPNVPAVYGWLTLDRRGNWLIKGERVNNLAVIEFIGRNYERTAQGCWFFQNGAQRVYVALDYTPVVYRVVSAFGVPLALEAQTGRRALGISGAWMDENGDLLVQSEHGVGIVLDRDLENVVPALNDANGKSLSEDDLEAMTERLQGGSEVALWLEYAQANVKVAPIRASDVARRFDFVAVPAPAAGDAACA